MDQGVNENEEERVENLNSNAETNNYGGNEKKHGTKWGILAVLALVIVVVVFASTVFGKVSAKKVFNISKNNAVSELYGNMIEDINTSAEITTTLNIDTEELSTLFGDSVNFGLLSLKNENVKENDDASGKISLLINKNEIIGANYAKTGDVIGVSVEGLFENYIAIENNNLKELYKKINSDVTDDELAQIPNKIEAMDSKNSSKEELLNICKKYANVIAEFYEKNATATKNIEIEVCGQKVNTTKYGLDVNNEKGCKLLKDILKIAENDEELFNFIKKYDAKGNLDLDEYSDWQEAVKSARAEIEDDISSNTYEDGIISFNIYEKNGMAVRYEVAFKEFEELSDCFLTFDAVESDGNVLGTIAYKTSGDYQVEYSLGINISNQNKKYDGKCTLNIAVSDLTPSSLEFITFDVSLLDDATTELVKLTDENTLILNTATDEEMDALTGEIKGNILTLIANVIKKLPEDIKTKLIENTANVEDTEIDTEDVETDAEEVNIDTEADFEDISEE